MRLAERLARRSTGRRRQVPELEFYAEHFDTVEVNSSFYRPRGEPVSTITRAVFLLGFEAIRDVADPDYIAIADGGRLLAP